jgi:hypothetical protein
MALATAPLLAGSLDNLTAKLARGFDVGLSGEHTSAKGRTTSLGPASVQFEAGNGAQFEGDLKFSAVMAPHVHAIVDPDQLFFSAQPRLAACWTDLRAADVPRDVKKAVEVLGLKNPASAMAARVRKEGKVKETGDSIQLKNSHGETWRVELGGDGLPRTLTMTKPSGDSLVLRFQGWQLGPPGPFRLPMAREAYQTTPYPELIALPERVQAQIQGLKKGVDELKTGLQKALRGLFQN